MKNLNMVQRLLAVAAMSGAMWGKGFNTKLLVSGEVAVPSARNRGKGRTNRQHQRTALKARNVKRHRAACRG